MKYLSVAKPQSKFIPNGVSIETLSLNLGDSKTRKKKAVFLDRDGTINVERGYLLDPNDIELSPRADEAIRTLNSLKIVTVVITNQASIDKKLLSLEQFEKINGKLWSELSNKNAYYDALYFCPHSPDIMPGCFCRKPRPGLILQAAKDFDIDLTSSFMVGDKLTDIEAGKASGCKTILLLSGCGEQSYKELKSCSGTAPDFVCRNLMDAVAWLLSDITEL